MVQVIDALTVRAPSGEASLQVLAAIAAEHHVDWTPAPATRQQDEAEAPPHAQVSCNMFSQGSSVLSGPGPRVHEAGGL